MTTTNYKAGTKLECALKVKEFLLAGKKKFVI